MKKNLWVLLALSALIAMFVIAGCAPKTTPSPTPPTASPTVPPADTECPEYVSTDVYKYFAGPCDTCLSDHNSVSEELYTNCDNSTPYFKIVITFNENIDELMSSCVYNPSNWEIKVKNSDRISTELTSKESEIWIDSVEIDGKKIIVTAGVVESYFNTVYPTYDDPTKIDYAFCGLICNLDDAKAYAVVVNGPFDGFPYPGVKKAPAIADEVTWELSSTCVIADELGNWCCGFSGSDCCVEPICEDCAPCPIGSSACL